MPQGQYTRAQPLDEIFQQLRKLLEVALPGFDRRRITVVARDAPGLSSLALARRRAGRDARIADMAVVQGLSVPLRRLSGPMVPNRDIRGDHKYILVRFRYISDPILI